MINTIKNQDCLIGMKEIPDKSVDMILCDLPYGTTQNSWDSVLPFDELWEHYNRIIKDNGAIALFGSEPFSSLIRMSNFDNYKYDIIWEKDKASNFLNAEKQILKIHETISIFYINQCMYNPQKKLLKKPYIHKNKSVKSDNFGSNSKSYDEEGYSTYTHSYPTSILRFSKDDTKKGIHPTQKPVKLFEYLIKTYTNENETVLDNCMGSGTTAIACINTKRNYIGFEMDKTYFDLATARIDKHTKEFNCEVGLFALPKQESLF